MEGVSMRKIFIFLLVVTLVLTSLVACSSDEDTAQKTQDQIIAEIKAEMEAEAKLKADKDVHNLDAVFTFIASEYPEYTREDFDKWTPNFFDLNANGKDEVVFTTTYFDGNLRTAIVIKVEEGEFKEIPSYIHLAKYENNISFEQGFLVNRSKSGGTGAFYYNMDLYVYDGYRIFNTLERSIRLKATVSAPDTSYNITSQMQGSLDDFVITLTKLDNQTEKEEVIAQDQYAYDSEGMFFWRKPRSLSNTAKRFEQVYNGDNLWDTIRYFDDHLYHFDKEGVKDFSMKVMQVIQKDRDKIYPRNDSVVYYITDEFYDFKTNDLDISALDEDTKAILKFIRDNGVYELSKSFYADQGEIMEGGFVVSIQPWAFEMLRPAVHAAYPDRFNPYNYNSIEPFLVPHIHFNAVKQVENTSIVYPNVYVYSYEDVKKLEGAETWKTNVIMPVNIVGK